MQSPELTAALDDGGDEEEVEQPDTSAPAVTASIPAAASALFNWWSP
jgi:hypothetical protein